MRALVQRVSSASVSVAGDVVGRINLGLVILLGVTHTDTDDDAHYLAQKCVNLRIFSDEQDKFNLSCLDVQGDLLVVSQFTLYGDTRKGRRPSFISAAPAEVSGPLYERFLSYVVAAGLKVEKGIFGAMMTVEICNDGPVTLLLESRPER